MGLAFGCAGTDGVPADEFAQILRTEGIQGFGGNGQAHFIDFDHELAGFEHSLGHVEGVVHVRIVDIAFPAHDGSWFLKINAHDREDGLGDVF